MQIIDHDAHISVEVPIQSDGVDALGAPGYAVRDARGNARREEIVQVNKAVAGRDLPCTQAARCQRKWIIRDDPCIRSGTGIVFAVFAGDGPASLCIPAIKMNRRQAERALDIVPIVLTLEEQWSQTGRGLHVIDLRVGDGRDSPSRNDGGRIDA